MFNNYLRPWINQRRHSSAANPPKKFFVAMLAMLFVGFSANAQQILDGTAIVPNHQSIQAAKMPVPGVQTPPTSPMIPDPMISILPPGVTGDAAYWNQMRRNRAAANNAKSGGSSSGPLTYTEREKGTGANDTPGTAERIRSFGLRSGQRNEACITGSLGDLPTRALTQTEDDGAIPLALASGVNGTPEQVSFSGVIGDGPMAGTVSDYDFVRVLLPANTTFTVAVKTPDPFGDLDPFVTFYLPDGTIIFQQDDGGDGFDTFVQLTVGPNALDFVMAIGGFGAFEPADPFNSTGGSSTGAIGSEGSYEFEFTVFGATDTDFYQVHLEKGDVFGAAIDVSGGPRVEIYNSKGELEKGVNGFGSFAVDESPLPIDGNGVIDYVVERNGDYTVGVSGGFGDYKLTLGVYKPEFEREKRRVQVVWLDYNGGPVSKEPWFGFPFITDHTPFRDFLPNLGLPNSDADVRRITRKITADVRDTYYNELRDSHVNRNLGVVVLGNDGTGAPNPLDALIASESFSILGLTFEVSEIEISGTINEAFISTIGIASEIDPGNYSVYDDALVLCDVLTGPFTGTNANNTFRLNDVILAPGKTMEDLAVTVFANVTAHEGGHYLGNFHTDGLNDHSGIMDEGPGGLFNLAGIGPSGVFGATDQIDVTFIDEDYSSLEGFDGGNNTTVNTAFGLSYFPFARYYDAPQMPVELASQLNPRQFASETLLNQSVPNSLLVDGVATIEFKTSEDSDAIIELYDLAGNKVGKIFEGAVKGGESNIVTLNAGDFNLKPGVYVYKLDTPTGSKHRKIVVKE
ncbi:MAG: T9SS type A sorting domain-containing protein [Bacteroidota bacterium]